MVDVTLTCEERFPEDTTVDALVLGQYEDLGTMLISRTPAEVVTHLGAAADSADVTDGELAFTGLTAERRYLAHAVVGASHVFVGFTTLTGE